jgi:hypothetical protein
MREASVDGLLELVVPLQVTSLGQEAKPMSAMRAHFAVFGIKEEGGNLVRRKNPMTNHRLHDRKISGLQQKSRALA